MTLFDFEDDGRNRFARSSSAVIFPFSCSFGHFVARNNNTPLRRKTRVHESAPRHPCRKVPISEPVTRASSRPSGFPRGRAVRPERIFAGIFRGSTGMFLLLIALQISDPREGSADSAMG